jgi:hypothetical protein
MALRSSTCASFPLTSISVIARLDRAIQYSRAVVAESLGQSRAMTVKLCVAKKGDTTTTKG